MLFILCFIISLPNSLADGSFVEAKLQVEQIFTATNASLPESQSTFFYVLESLDPKNPMPEGISQSTYSFSVVGTQTIFLPAIQYRQAGNYEYKIYQRIPEKENYTYDRRVYHIVIYVQMKNTGELGAEIVAYNEDGKKVAAISFHNTYEIAGPSPSASVPPSPLPSSTISPTTKPPVTAEPIPTGDKNTALLCMGGMFFFIVVLLWLIHIKIRL